MHLEQKQFVPKGVGKQQNNKLIQSYIFSVTLFSQGWQCRHIVQGRFINFHVLLVFFHVTDFVVVFLCFIVFTFLINFQLSFSSLCY